MRTIPAAVLSLMLSLSSWAQAPSLATAASRRSLRIVFAPEPPRIDGLLTDPAWDAAERIDGFVQLSPALGAPAGLSSEVRLMRDETHLFVSARLRHPPTSPVQRQLARRDTVTQADWFEVALDGYHDLRTAQVFAVNAAGVQRDYLLYEDIQEDVRWDAVWESAVELDAEGWTAELSIPLAQLRFDPSTTTWGVQLTRFAHRDQELSAWQSIPLNQGVKVSRFGEAKLERPPRAPTQVELRPYVMAGANTYAPDIGNPFRTGWGSRWSLGGDLKWAMGTSWYLNATVNPDFGQVEADPAQVNLTDQQLFFPEQRPFFLEGVDLFSAARGAQGSGGVWGGPPNLFYSRRIGAGPTAFVSRPDDAAFVDRPLDTPIYGALKLTGRTGSGFSLGILDAVTAPVEERYARDSGAMLDDRRTVQPLAHFMVVRGQQELRDGSTVGLLATTVNRRLGTALRDSLAGNAHTGGLDWNVRLPGGSYFVAGRLLGSRVDGSAQVMTRLQRNFVRYNQRPDADHLEVDPDATNLMGLSGQLRAGLVGQARWGWDVGAHFTTPNFEANDLGFQNRADELALTGRVVYQDREPGNLLRQWTYTLNGAAPVTFGGELLQPRVSMDYSATTLGFIPFGAYFVAYLPGLDDRLLRGGPIAQGILDVGLNLRVGTDVRRQVRANLYGNAGGSVAGGEDWIIGGSLVAEPTPALTLSLAPQIYLAKKDAQYVAAYDDAAASQTFGRQYLTAQLANVTSSIEARADWTFSPKISLQTFARASVATAEYAGYRYFAQPGTRDFVDPGSFSELDGGRLVARAPGSSVDFGFDDPDFVFSSLQANAVFRWEYAPGATLFLVYQLACGGSTGGSGAFDLRAYGNLCRGSTPENTVMAKVTYWLSP